MHIRRSYRILIAVFLLALFARLYFSFQTPYLDNPGYLIKRYTENILDTGRPLFYDQLSYNGREVLYSPLWHYILSVFSIVFGNAALKLIPAIFASLLVFVVYLLSKKI